MSQIDDTNNSSNEAVGSSEAPLHPFNDLHQYQLAAREFAEYNGQSFYPFFGLAEETGEVCGKIAKHLRGDIGAELQVEPLAQELGDVLWMLSQCCAEMNISLADVALANIRKLAARKEQGTIKGDGDTR